MTHSRTPAERAAHRRAVIARTKLQLRRARRSAAIVAVAIGVAALSAVLLTSRMSGASVLGGSAPLRVAVDNAKSVVPGKNEVRWAGVVIGRITKVELSGGPPVLEARLDPDKVRPLYRDARLRLRPQTALNDMYLDVEDPGTRAAGELKPGEVLPAARTRVAVDVAEVLNVFSESVRDRLEQALDELSVGLPDGGAQLRSAFTEFVPFLAATGRLGGALARRDRAARRLVTRLRVITDELATRDRHITRLAVAGGATFDELGARRTDLDRLVQELPPTLEQMQGSLGRLQTTLGEARPALAALRPAVRRLPAGLTALDSIVRSARPAIAAAEPAIRALSPLARDLEPTATALAAAFERLAPQAPRIDRVTEKVARCELPLQKFFAWTMSVFKFGNRTNLTSSPRGLLVGSAADATDGNDPNLTGLRGCADGRTPE